MVDRHSSTSSAGHQTGGAHYHDDSIARALVVRVVVAERVVVSDL